MMSPKPTPRHAMSIMEILVSVVVITSLSMSILPALAKMRGDANNEMSKANLMELGQGRDQYAMENKDRIFSYTWRAGEVYVMPDGRAKNPNNDQEAAAYQNEEILERRTGRAGGIYRILNFSFRLPHRRFTHLILLDDMVQSDQEFQETQLGIDPADQNLLTWHERPLEYQSESGVPYANGGPEGYDNEGNWSATAMLQRWAFSSSYQVVPHAWIGDGSQNVFYPISSTPHLYTSSGFAILGRRHMTEVAFPSKKVHMHEEFDYEQARHPFFAYDHAMPEKLMFDGSINSRPSGKAYSSVNSQNYDINNPQDINDYPAWTQVYVPLDTFPVPLGGFGDQTELNMRYRWTLFGLQGVDYD